jgi:hypothetical protein
MLTPYNSYSGKEKIGGFHITFEKKPSSGIIAKSGFCGSPGHRPSRQTFLRN